MPAARVPLALKLAYAAWMAVWVPAYWLHNGADNFLWLCDVANFVVAAAVFLESPLLFSASASGVLVVQLVWIVDVLGRILFGVHPVGGTEYMFDAAEPLAMRLLSLFHVAMPALLLWGVRRLGHDRRGWKLQSVFVWILLPATYFLTDPANNINWVWKPFGVEQTLVPPLAYLGVCMLAYPLLLFWPTHLLLARWDARRR